MQTKAANATQLSRVPGMALEDALAILLKREALDIDADQLIAGLPYGEAGFSEDLLVRATRRLGYGVVWQQMSKLEFLDFPCCIPLTSGSYAVVLGIEEGMVHVLDDAQPEVYRNVLLSLVQAQYDRRSFQVLPSSDLLLERHSSGAVRGHWFWGRLLLQKGVLTHVITASLLANLLAVVTSLFVLQVYDRVIPGQSEATLWVLASGVALAILFEATLRISRARLIDQAGKEAEIEITSDLFSRAIGMKLDKRPASPGAMVHIVREFSAVKEFFTTAAVGVVADLPFVFIFLFLIYGIAGNIVWVILIGAILMVVPSFLLQSTMVRLSKETMGGASSASRLLTESLYGLETVKTTRSESQLQNQWEEIIALNALKTTQQRSLGAFLTYWASSMQQSSYISAVIVGVYMIFAGELSVGAIIAVGILTTRTLSPIAQLSQVLSRWQNMKTALIALDTIMSAKQERSPHSTYIRRPRAKGQLAFQNVEFTHPGSQPATLQIEKLGISAGTRLALLGPNGSGKSTLLRLASGLYEPTGGALLLDGLDLRQIDPQDLRRNIGYLPQEVKMFRGTLRSNLAQAGLNDSDERMIEALVFGGLGEFIRQHPEGLDLTIHDGGEGLSIGQRQSIGLARIYMQDPAIILLDEPTAALDQNLESELVMRIGEWIGSRTCIVATHRTSILAQMSHVAVLQQGHITLSGRRDAVLDKVMGAQSSPKQVDAS